MNNLSTALYNLDEGIVNLMANFDMPTVPQNIVDTSAGWGDALTSVPFTDFSLTKSIRKEMGNSDFVNFGSNAYSIGQVGGMARVTRWGRPGLMKDDWVMMGAKDRFNWIFSGTSNAHKYSSATTHVVPKKSLVNPYLHRPANEPAIISTLKQISGMNKIQRIYKP